MKYLFIFILLSLISFAKTDEEVYLYYEIQGPQKSLLAPNLEVKLFDFSNDSISEGSLRLRGGVTLLNLLIFTFQPSYLAGLHYILGQEKKLDLGVAMVYEKYKKYDLFNSATSLSFTVGFRHSIGDDWFIGGAICPTYSKENIPSYPVSFKFGFSI